MSGTRFRVIVKNVRSVVTGDWLKEHYISKGEIYT